MCAKKRKQAKKRGSAIKRQRKVFRQTIIQANGAAAGQIRVRYAIVALDTETAFDDEQKARIATQIEVTIPFGLPGVPVLPITVYDDDGNQSVVELAYMRHPMNIVTHALGKMLAKGDIRTLDMDGDSWGRIAYTHAKVTLPYYCRTKPGPSTDEQGAPTIDMASRKLLERVCVVLNKLIGVYVLHTNRYDIRELAPSDFLSYSAKHLLDGRTYNPIQVFYLNTLHVNSPQVVLPQASLDSMREVLGSPEALNLVYRLLFRARWSLELGNRRVAVIDAVTGLEMALSDFVRERALRKGISSGEIDKLLRDVGLSGNLKVLLPLVLTDSETDLLDDELVLRCSGEIRTRNKIVHEGLPDVDSAEVKRALDDITQFVQFLDAL